MIQVQLLHVPGCPHVDAARRLLSSCMQELGVAASIQEREGAFPSPSILVNGVDAMGAPASAEAHCRLDTPTRDRVLAALRGALA